MLSLQEPSRRGAAEPVQDEAPSEALLPDTKQLLQVCLNDSGGPPGPGELAEERTEFLHSQNPPSPCRYPLSLPSPAAREASASRGRGRAQPPVLSRAPPRSSLSDEAPVLPNTTPDLLLATTAKPAAPSEGRETLSAQVSRSKALEPHKPRWAQWSWWPSPIYTHFRPPPQDGPGSPGGFEDKDEPAPELRASFLPRTLSLRNSISKSESGARVGWALGAEWEGAWPALPWLNPPPLPTVMSEAGSETLEDEWQSISEIASTCNTILESLSREGEATRVLRG